MVHGEDRYIRNHEYSTASRMPHMPAVSEPPVYDSNTIKIEDLDPTAHAFQEGEFICPGFFDKINIDCFKAHHETVEWNYNMRRNAQAILPFLYLGPSSTLKDMDYLSVTGFTLLLGIRSRQSAQARLVSGESQAKLLGIEVDSIDVMDSQELIATLPRAIRLINDHLSSPGQGDAGYSPKKKIFVFCESGNERSAIVVVAYFMVMFNLELATATSVVQRQRFSISIDDKMRLLMSNFESILEAKRDVECTRRAVATPEMTMSRKRTHIDSLESDDEMDIDEDSNSADGRKPMAPFKDR